MVSGKSSSQSSRESSKERRSRILRSMIPGRRSHEDEDMDLEEIEVTVEPTDQPPSHHGSRHSSTTESSRSTGHIDTGQLTAMKSDPLGKLLWEVIYKVNELYGDRHGGMQDADREPIDVGRIANDFYDSLGDKRRLLDGLEVVENQVNNIHLNTALQEAKSSTLESRLAETERKLKEDNLLDGMYENPMFVIQVKPPTDFPTRRRLKSTEDLTQAYKLFPRGTGRFSGERNSHFQVQEFLETLNEIQEFFQLNEEEFKARMLGSCTGKAHEMMTHWKKKGYTVPQLYHSLYLNFNKQDSPMAAQTKLDNFKILKTRSSAESESHVSQLALKASQKMPMGDARNTFYDHLSANTYIEALPSQASAFVRTKYNDLAVQLKRPPSFSELSQILDPHRYYLDMEIRKHGQAPSKNKEDTNNKYINYVGEENPRNHQGKREQHSKKGKQDNSHKKPRFQKRDKYEQRTHRPDKQGKASAGKPEPPGKPSNKQSDKRQDKYCSLCGGKNHNASEGCYRMKDDRGDMVLVTPAYGYCSLCPHKLHHPEKYCPFKGDRKT